MFNLFKSELYRFFKAKHTLILALVGVFLAIILPVLQFVLKTSISSLAEAYSEAYGETYSVDNLITFSALSTTQSALNPGSLFAFVVSIFVILILVQDYRNGTIRNKVICGISRFKIYSTYYLVSLIFILAMLFGYGLLTFLFSLIFFPVVPEGVVVSTFVGQFFLAVLFDLLNILFIISAALICVSLFRTVGLSLLVFIVAQLGLQVVGSFINSASTYLKLYETNVDGVVTLMNVMNWINPFYLLSTISITQYNTADLVFNIVTPIVWCIVNLGLGYLATVKKDIK